jgi:hypothetical protein
MSVVCLIGSSASKRPFESIRCEAKMVLISVDFPSPVWPVQVSRNFTEERRGDSTRQRSSNKHYGMRKLTDDDDIELEAALEELFLDLTGDGVEADVRRCSDLLCGWLRHIY